jgi:hypothetical protein
MNYDDWGKTCGNGLAPVLQCTGAAAMRTRGQNWTRVTLATAPVHWSTGGKPDPKLATWYYQEKVKKKKKKPYLLYFIMGIKV